MIHMKVVWIVVICISSFSASICSAQAPVACIGNPEQGGVLITAKSGTSPIPFRDGSMFIQENNVGGFLFWTPHGQLLGFSAFHLPSNQFHLFDSAGNFRMVVPPTFANSNQGVRSAQPSSAVTANFDSEAKLGSLRNQEKSLQREIDICRKNHDEWQARFERDPLTNLTASVNATSWFSRMKSAELKLITVQKDLAALESNLAR
jgi:hypothetical protein